MEILFYKQGKPFIWDQNTSQYFTSHKRLRLCLCLCVCRGALYSICVLLDGNLNIIRIFSPHFCVYIFNGIPVQKKLSGFFFFWMGNPRKIDLRKWCMYIVKKNLEKEKCSSVKKWMYYKVSIIRSMCHWQRNKANRCWSRIKRNWQVCGNLVDSEGGISNQWKEKKII